MGVNSLIKRRALFQAKLEEDYADFDFGVISGSKVDVLGCFAVSPLIPIPDGCTAIRYRNGSPNGFIRLAFLDENEVDVASASNYPAESGGRETLDTAVQSTYKYIRICVNVEDVDNCYIKDMTHSTYIWKGKNVT
jgi:hypothetical protein